MKISPTSLWYVLPLIFAVFVGAVLGLLLALTQDLPQVESLSSYEPSAVTHLVSADGAPVQSLFIERRIPVTLDKVPSDLVKAVIAVEDARFYQHFGLDLRGIARALWRDVTALRVVEGGSTLTQQLAKVLFLTPEKTVLRKLREALLAVNIERRYSKDEILSMYMNQIYLGEGSYGVEAAARTYFDRGVSDLNLSECALLAGIPRSPSNYSPFANPERADGRRRVVLKRLLEEGLIPEATYLEALDQTPRVKTAAATEDPAPYFSETVRRQAEASLGANLLYRGGLTIETTLDISIQAAATRAVQDGLSSFEARHRPARAGDNQPIQAALLALDPVTGDIKAMVGGRDFQTSAFNRASQARRQPGSAFKPILYTAALAAGFTPSDLVHDEPIEIRVAGSPLPYIPENYSGDYQGTVPLRKALELSLNAASVDLLMRLGYQPVIDTAGRLGITAELKSYPSLALGAFDVSLEELTAAYGAFANGGILARPHAVRRVVDRDGSVLFEARPELSDAVSPQTAYLITSLLEGAVERGTGQAARSLGRPVAGKTGTTNDFRDAWFIGYVPGLVAGVWVGYDTPRSLGRGEAGAVAALPIWVEFMRTVLSDIPPQGFVPPDGIELVEVDPASGLLAGPACRQTIVEAFASGTSPSAVCTTEGGLPSLDTPPFGL